jgi:hypothetical protein
VGLAVKRFADDILGAIIGYAVGRLLRSLFL